MRQRFVRPFLAVGAALLLILLAMLWRSPNTHDRPDTAAGAMPAVDVPAAVPPPPPVFASEYYRDVKPIFDRRCLVCHGGYDAPCQLRLDSPEGLQRGATQQPLHDAERAMPAPLTRLFTDARNTAEWRDKGFHPVIDEGAIVPADPQNSVLYRMLALKRTQPAPVGFDGAAERRDACPRVEDFTDYAAARPLRGMPLALPALDDEEFGKLQRWLESGAKVAPLPPLPADLQKAVTDWERFLNNEDPKSQLMSRYLYEHLFLADLYFGAREPRQFFRLVRSRTPSGQPVDVIASRRPTDDPDVARVFYRLRPVQASVVAKTHLPYLLDERRMARWRELFLQANYSIERPPSYTPEVAGNPFVAFEALPVQSRYRFLLDDAAFFFSGLAKGPNSTAAGVLQDQFWVAFAHPDRAPLVDGAFLARESGNLRLPVDNGGKATALARWQSYGVLQANHLAAKDRMLREKAAAPGATLDALWQGDGSRGGAALTVFRHAESISVVEGLVGSLPKTAWVVDYPLFERLHYLQVAGFDVYGDATQQSLTRLYMDFLRMEGEANFLAFLPRARRESERNGWYQGVGAKQRESVYRKSDAYRHETGIVYRSKNSKREFFELLRARIEPAAQPPAPAGAELDESARAALQKIGALRGRPVSYLPELTYLRLVIRGAPDQIFTLIHNVDRSNVSALEQSRRRPLLDTATLVPGIVGAYPNSIWVVKDSDLPQLARSLAALDSKASYLRLEDAIGVARSNPKFWQHSDWLHNIYRELEPVGWGALDFSRYDP